MNSKYLPTFSSILLWESLREIRKDCKKYLVAGGMYHCHRGRYFNRELGYSLFGEMRLGNFMFYGNSLTQTNQTKQTKQKLIKLYYLNYNPFC